MITLGNKHLCEYCLTENSGEPCRFCGFDKATFKKEAGALAPGSVLSDRYIVGKIMGNGGFGITYLAYDIKQEKKIALKEYFPVSFAMRGEDGSTIVVSRSDDSSIYKNGMDKFYEEARLVSSFNGEHNIVSVYEFFYENQTAYFVMELLRGCTLKAYVEQHGSLTPEQTLYVADKISDALVAAHGKKILHRDITPDNIMLCKDGSVKLIDFGSARMVAADNPKSMSVILKQGYAPLEQYQRRGNQGAWTDLYSLSATLYYAVTGECIDDPMTRLEDDDAFQSNSHGIEPQLWEVIKRALNLKIGDRYKNAAEFREALEKISYKPQEIKVELSDSDQAKTREPVPVMAAAGDMKSDQPEETKPGLAKSEEKKPEQAKSEEKKPERVKSEEKKSEQAKSEEKKPERVKSEEKKPEQTKPEEKKPEQTKPEEKKPKQTKPAEKKPQKRISTVILSGVMGIVLVVGLAVLAIVLLGKKKPAKPEDSGQQTSTVQSSLSSEPSSSSAVQSTSSSVLTSSEPVESKDVLTATIKGRQYDISTTELVLTGLSLNNDDIKNLKYFKELTTLRLDNNNITDLSVISQLTKLKSLNIDNNKVSDLSFVSNMNDLEIIWAENNGITDISPLSGCTKLRTVSLSGNAVNDLSPLYGISLEMLRLVDNKINNPTSFVNSLYGLSMANGGYLSVYDSTGKTVLFFSRDDAIACKNAIIANSGIFGFTLNTQWFDGVSEVITDSI